MKSGNLNFLEPSGPLRACNGTALLFFYYGFGTWSVALTEKRRLRVFEGRVLRRVFGPQKEEVMEERRILNNMRVYALYPLPNIIRVIKSRKMRRAGRVARMGNRRGTHRVLVGENLRERDCLKDLCIAGR
jgi:ribosomal protein S21